MVGDRLCRLAIGTDRRAGRDRRSRHHGQMTRYPADVGDFLTYRLSIPMQYRDNSYTVPLVKNNKLAALLLRFDPRTQVLDAIPAPIIAHFLKDAEQQNIAVFLRSDFAFSRRATRNLRKFAGQTGKAGRRLCHQCRTGLAGGERRDCKPATSSPRSARTRSTKTETMSIRFTERLSSPI